MNETEEWIQKYIQKQIEGMVFRSEEERQHRIQQARQSAEAYLQAHQKQAQGNPGPTRRIDPYSDEGRQMWERETGDTVHNPGTQQRYFEWAKRMKEGGGGSRGNVQQKRFGLWQDAGGSENPQVSQKVGNYLRNLGYIVRVYKKELGPPGLEYDYWFVDFDVPAMSHGERTRKGTEFWQKHDQIIKRMFAEDR